MPKSDFNPPLFERPALRTQFAEAHIDELLPAGVVAAGVGHSSSWLELQRIKGNGPAFIKVGRRVLYRKRDVNAWLEDIAPQPSRATVSKRSLIG